MSGLALVAALSAQAAAQTGAPPPASSPAPSETPTAQRAIGQSTYVDLEAGVGYSTNPLLTITGNHGSGFGRISAHVVHTRSSARTTTVLSGFAQALGYTRQYGVEKSFDLSARHDAAVTEKLRLYFDADAAYDEGGQLDRQILAVPQISLFPGTTGLPVLVTPGSDFLTVTGRTYRFGANAGGQFALSGRESVDFSTGISHANLKAGNLNSGYTQVPVSIGYSRQLNERASAGARVVGQFTHYNGDLTSGLGDSQVITPELTANLLLSQTVTLAGDVGASFSSVKDGVRTRHSTGLAADVNLCSKNERSSLCAHVSLQQQAATTAGPAHVISIGADYSRRLTAHDTLEFSLGADRYSNPIILVAGRTFSRATYARAVVNYARNFSDRWYGGVNLSARKVTESGPDPKADIAASLFIRYRFGDVR